MKSETLPSFWNEYKLLPFNVRQNARKHKV